MRDLQGSGGRLFYRAILLETLKYTHFYALRMQWNKLGCIVFLCSLFFLVGFKSSDPNTRAPDDQPGIFTFSVQSLNWNAPTESTACSNLWLTCQNNIDEQLNACKTRKATNCDAGYQDVEAQCKSLVQSCYTRVQSAQQSAPSTSAPTSTTPASTPAAGFDVKSYSFTYKYPQLPWDWEKCYNSLDACKKAIQEQYTACKEPIEREGRRVCYASLCWNFWSNRVDEKCGVEYKKVEEHCYADYKTCEDRATNSRNQQTSAGTTQKQQKCASSGGSWVSNTLVCRCGEEKQLDAEGESCIPIPQEDSCIDSDGSNKYAQGLVTVKTSAGTTTYSDECQSQEFLLEKDCASNRPVQKTYSCDCGCKTGACQTCTPQEVRDVVDTILPGHSECSVVADCDKIYGSDVKPTYQCAENKLYYKTTQWVCKNFECIDKGEKSVIVKTCLEGCVSGRCVVKDAKPNAACTRDDDCTVQPTGLECSNNDFWTNGKGSVIRKMFGNSVCMNKKCIPDKGVSYTSIVQECGADQTCVNGVKGPLCADAKTGRLEEVQKKCTDPKNNNPTVSANEYLAYLQKLETDNPGMTRNQLVAKLHAKAYEVDVDATYFGLKLFQKGAETDGSETVKLYCKNEPKFVLGKNGKPIDIAHAYAGIRSDMNRGALSRWFMRNVNTHWGDTFQTIAHLDSRYAPPDQRAGNDAGIWLAKYYLDDANKNKPLSEGMRDYFAHLGTPEPSALTGGVIFGWIGTGVVST